MATFLGLEASGRTRQSVSTEGQAPKPPTPVVENCVSWKLISAAAVIHCTLLSVIIIIAFAKGASNLLASCLIVLLLTSVTMTCVQIRYSSQILLYVGSIIYIIALLGTDLAQAAAGYLRTWPLAIFIIDLHIIMELPSIMCASLVTIISVWILLDACEVSWGMGMYSMPDTNGNSIPLPLLWGVSILYIASISTSALVRHKKAIVNTTTTSSVLTVINIISTAVDTDSLSEVHERIGAFDLSSEFESAFSNLIFTLETYRSFLPQQFVRSVAANKDPDNVDSVGSPIMISINRNESTNGSEPFRLRMSRVSIAQQGLRKTRMSMLVTNFGSSLALESNQLDGMLENYLAHCMSKVIDQRGIIDHLLGDRIIASFNSSLRCLHHAKHAVATAKAIVDIADITSVLDPQQDGSLTPSGNPLASSRRGKLSASSQGTGSENCTAGSQESLADLEFAGLEVSQCSRCPSPILINVGVAGGTALCGYMGTDSFRRHNIIGGLPLWVSVIERLGKSWGVYILCDSFVESDVCNDHELRIRLERCIFPKRGSSDPAYLWEVIRECDLHESMSEFSQQTRSTGTNPEEWMYEIDKASRSRAWEAYNKACKLYFKAEADAALKVLAGANYRSVSTQKLEEMIRGSDAIMVPIINLTNMYEPKMTAVNGTRKLRKAAAASRRQLLPASPEQRFDLSSAPASDLLVIDNTDYGSPSIETDELTMSGRLALSTNAHF